MAWHSRTPAVSRQPEVRPSRWRSWGCSGHSKAQSETAIPLTKAMSCQSSRWTAVVTHSILLDILYGRFVRRFFFRWEGAVASGRRCETRNDPCVVQTKRRIADSGGTETAFIRIEQSRLFPEMCRIFNKKTVPPCPHRPHPFVKRSCRGKRQSPRRCPSSFRRVRC